MKEIIDFLRDFNAQTILSMIAILWYFTRGIKNDISSEIKVIREEIKVIREEIKSNRDEFNTTQDAQVIRSDRLYQMFIELLRDKK